MVGAHRGAGKQPNAVQGLIWSTARGGCPSKATKEPSPPPPLRDASAAPQTNLRYLAAGSPAPQAFLGRVACPFGWQKSSRRGHPGARLAGEECPGPTESERTALPAGGGARPTSAAHFRCPGVAPAARPTAAPAAEAWPTSPPTRTRGRPGRTPTSACARTPRSRRPGVCGAPRRATSRLLPSLPLYRRTRTLR